MNDCPRHVVIFDLDDTLVKGDSCTRWLDYIGKLGWVEPTAAQEKHRKAIDDYRRGALDIGDYCSFHLRAIEPIEREVLAQVIADFIRDEIAPNIYPQARAAINAHRADGATLLLISATGEFLVGSIGAYLGFDTAIGVTCETHAGQISATACKPTPYREGKRDVFDQWCAQQPSAMIHSTFYSDSLNDRFLLEAVDTPIVVNPDDALREIALARSWTIKNWH